MFFHELLKGFDLKTVLLLRHRPHEPEINEVLPWLVVQKPNVFNAYQQTQSERVEAAMIKLSGKGYIASFIGQKAKKATFAGLYRIGGMKELQFDDWWKIPEHDELRNYGQEGMTLDGKRKKVIWFDLQLDESFYAHWRGKLIIEWLPPERSWCRRAHKKHYPIHAILDESTFDPPKAQWDEIDYSWKQLEVLPHRIRKQLSDWRGIYYIFDTNRNKGYVGAAYGDGEDGNIYGRWMNYAASGHGGNVKLRKCDPNNFRFSILQIMAHNADKFEVEETERKWKVRLHTRGEGGLNDN